MTKYCHPEPGDGEGPHNCSLCPLVPGTPRFPGNGPPNAFRDEKNKLPRQRPVTDSLSEIDLHQRDPGCVSLPTYNHGVGARENVLTDSRFAVVGRREVRAFYLRLL